MTEPLFIMNTIKLLIFSSQLHDGASVLNSRSPLFEGLRKAVNLELIYPSTLASRKSSLGSMFDGGNKNENPIDNNDAHTKTVCFIATGGTEEIFRNYISSLSKPVYLLSDGFHNSFAATMEIGTYLGSEGIQHRIFNAPLDYNQNFFTNFIEELFGEDALDIEISSRDKRAEYSKQVMHTLSKSVIGILGGSSSWLISSDIDAEYVSKTFGARFVNIDLAEVIADYQTIDDNCREISEIANRMERFLVGGRTREHLSDAAKFYIALKNICAKYALTALTIKCFDILDSCRTTACLALALLNDEGIVCGCEGDIPTLWSMIYAKAAYGRISFMANPSSSNASENTIDFAHCTVPFSMLHGYRLPSHFESSTGIGIAGSIPCGRYRIIKLYGKRLDNMYSVEGDVIMNTNVPQRCRTQIRFKFDTSTDFSRFITTSKGNHIVIVKA